MKVILKIALVLFIILLAILYLGCKVEDSVNSFDGLANRLKSEGFQVESSGEKSQDIFSVKAKIIGADDEDIQVFEYDTKAQVDEDIRLFSPAMISWEATPHFYRTDKMIILYIGDNDKIISSLNDIIGPQFAGGSE